MGAAGGVDLWAFAHRVAMQERMRAAKLAGDDRRAFDIALVLILPALKRAIHP